MISLLLLMAFPANASSWPTSDDWTPLRKGGTPMSDPCFDVSGNDWWDVVGTPTEPVAYTYNDGTDLWFRLRISDSPGSGSWNQFGWGVMIETDWSTEQEKYDYILYVDGKTDRVTFAENLTGQTPFTTDPAEVEPKPTRSIPIPTTIA